MLSRTLTFFCALLIVFCINDKEQRNINANEIIQTIYYYQKEKIYKKIIATKNKKFFLKFLRKNIEIFLFLVNSFSKIFYNSINNLRCLE